MRKSTLIGSVLLFGIITSLGICLSPPRPASLLQTYDAETEGYWGMVPKDVLIYALYDNLHYNTSNYDVTHYALAKHEILSCDDQGLDNDSLPDLLMNTYFLIGNEEIKVSIGQYFDINFIGLLMDLLGTLTGGGSGSSVTLALPSFPSLHIVSSELLNLINNLSAPFFYDGDLPLYSFEMQTQNTPFNDAAWTNYAESPNSIYTRKLFGSRNWSKGLEFNLADNTKKLGISLNDLAIEESAGHSQFFFHPGVVAADGTMYYMQYDEIGSGMDNRNGVLLALNKTGLYQYQGLELWFDNGIIQTWVPNIDAGNWTYIAPLLSNWNNISITFGNDYTKPINLKVNEVNYNANFSVSQSSYPYRIDSIQFEGNGTNGAQTYLDDFNLAFNLTIGDLQSFFLNLFGAIPLSYLLRITSLYSLFYMPRVLNWDAFYNLMGFLLDQIANTLIGILGANFGYGWGNPSLLRQIFQEFVFNSESEFSININGTKIKDMIGDFLELLGMDFNIVFVEGHANWYFKTTWDKYNGCLNQSVFHIDYTDINATRELGIKLIATRSPEPVQEGYYYYNSSWFDNNYIRLRRPYAQLVSTLNGDRYPSTIPPEWDIFDPQKLTEAFLEEFNYSPLIIQILQDNGWLVAGIIGGIIGASIAGAWGIEKLLLKIRARKVAKSR